MDFIGPAGSAASSRNHALLAPLPAKLPASVSYASPTTPLTAKLAVESPLHGPRHVAHPSSREAATPVAPLTAKLAQQGRRAPGLPNRPDAWPGCVEALIERIVYLGFEVRVELLRRDGSRVWAQIPRDQAEQLELKEGQIVSTRARDARTFPDAKAQEPVDQAPVAPAAA